MMSNPFYDLPPELQDALREKAGGSAIYIPKRPRLTKDEIDRAIRENGGVAMAAASLSITRKTIYQRIRRNQV